MLVYLSKICLLWKFNEILLLNFKVEVNYIGLNLMLFKKKKYIWKDEIVNVLNFGCLRKVVVEILIGLEDLDEFVDKVFVVVFIVI